MTLGSDVASQIPYLREQALSLMVDSAVVTRGGGPPTFNPATGEMEPSAGTEIYAGACRLRMPSAQEAVVIFGEQPTTKTRYIACFPLDCTEVRIGDVITFTDSDIDVLERSFRVSAVPVSTYVLYRAFPCESVEVDV